MKKLTKILSGLMMLAAMSASAWTTPALARNTFAAPTDILTKGMTFDPGQHSNFRYSSDDVTDPAEREEMRMKMRRQYSEVSRVNAPMKENEKLYTVKCVFKGEDMPYFAIYNPDFFVESRMGIWIESGETDTYYFQIPAGTYDVNAQYFSKTEGKIGNGYLVIENVEINADTTVEFTTDMLTEEVVFKPYLRDGRQALLPIGKDIDEEPWFEIDDSNANTKFTYLSYMFFREGCEPLTTGYAISNYKYEDGDFTFLSNRLSDKYHFVFQYFIANDNDEIEITTTDMAGSESGEVRNYIGDFVRYEAPQFANTPVYHEVGPNSARTAVMGILWIDDVEAGGGGMIMESLNPDIYVSTQPTTSPFDIKAPVNVTNIQAEKIITWEEEWDGQIHQFSERVRAEIVTLPALYNGTEWEYINQNHSECGNFGYQIPAEGPIVEYPGVPAYCYFADEISQPLGNSSPVLAMQSQINVYPDYPTIFRFSPQAYIGRYGEVRRCDNWDLRTVVNLDGKTVFDNINGGNLDNWCIENSTDGHEKGIIEATFTNRNVLVDETIPGFNITSIKVDERNEDRCTPTTQMLIFKNTDGKITDRFAKAEDGIIEFSAGDFNSNYIGSRFYYTCEEAEVKVEYAPYGEQTFLPLEVTEIPENYFMPGFGYFYRGSLKDVAIPSANGWYDIRFTLTDKAGNEMVQHISPAFRIDNNVGVTAPAVNGQKVWAANGTVFAAGDDIASIELFTPDGKRIAYANASSVSSNGHRGIAIVRVTSSNGSASTLKTAIP